MRFADRIPILARAFAQSGLPFAFGGALALAFHVREPRATRDIDINVFVPVEQIEDAFAALPDEVEHTPEQLALARRDGQIRLFWDDTPVDLFFRTHRFHDVAASRVENVELEGVVTPILSATDLAVFKVFFNRTRDWADLEQMVAAGTVDLHEVVGWIVELLGSDDERVARLRTLLVAPPVDAEPRFPTDAAHDHR